MGVLSDPFAIPDITSYLIDFIIKYTSLYIFSDLVLNKDALKGLTTKIPFMICLKKYFI